MQHPSSHFVEEMLLEGYQHPKKISEIPTGLPLNTQVINLDLVHHHSIELDATKYQETMNQSYLLSQDSTYFRLITLKIYVYRKQMLTKSNEIDEKQPIILEASIGNCSEICKIWFKEFSEAKLLRKSLVISCTKKDFVTGSFEFGSFKFSELF